jgi:hypothetical protein
MESSTSFSCCLKLVGVVVFASAILRFPPPTTPHVLLTQKKNMMCGKNRMHALNLFLQISVTLLTRKIC